MPIHKVKAPDGSIIKVQAPDGATQEEIIKYAQENYKPQKLKVEVPDPVELHKAQADKQSFLHNLLVGIGGGMTSLGQGVGQRLGLVDQETVDETRNAMDGLNQTGGGILGNIVGQAALATPTMFIPGVNTYGGATILGGTMGAAQPTREDESVLLNTAVGAAGGAAGKYAGDKIAKILGGNPNAKLTQTQQRVKEKAEQLGFKLTPGQATGSKGLQKVEMAMESNPFTSRPFDEIKDHNQTIINRIAAKAIGENSDSVDEVVLQTARDRIGDVYDSVATASKQRVSGERIVDGLAEVESNFEGLLPKSLSDDILVKKFMKIAETGEATGRQLQSLSSKLGKLSYKHMTTPMGDRDYGMAMGAVKDVVDDTLADTLDDSTRALFDEARGQYRNLMLLTQRNTVLNPSDGNVKGNALAGLLQKRDRSGFLFGGNNSDLYNAARFGQAFRPIVGDSGTATRSALMNRGALELAISPITNNAARIYTSPPVNWGAKIANNGLIKLDQQTIEQLGRLGLLSGASASNNLYK